MPIVFKHNITKRILTNIFVSPLVLAVPIFFLWDNNGTRAARVEDKKDLERIKKGIYK